MGIRAREDSSLRALLLDTHHRDDEPVEEEGRVGYELGQCGV